MRELKFRAWHRESKAMYWFDLMWGNTSQHGSGWIGMLPFGEDRQWRAMRDNRIQIDPDNCEIMQFTGLQDKNGVDIYEGDILEYDDNEGYTVRTQVTFENATWYADDQDMVELALNFWWSVVGNIHENPDLVE